MKLVIDISEETYNLVKKYVSDGITNPLKICIANGTQLSEVLGEIKGEIEQVKVIMNEQVYEHERKDLIHFINGMNQCLCIIDSHISGKEQE